MAFEQTKRSTMPCSVCRCPRPSDDSSMRQLDSSSHLLLDGLVCHIYTPLRWHKVLDTVRRGEKACIRHARFTDAADESLP